VMGRRCAVPPFACPGPASPSGSFARPQREFSPIIVPLALALIGEWPGSRRRRVSLVEVLAIAFAGSAVRLSAVVRSTLGLVDGTVGCRRGVLEPDPSPEPTDPTIALFRSSSICFGIGSLATVVLVFPRMSLSDRLTTHSVSGLVNRLLLWSAPRQHGRLALPDPRARRRQAAGGRSSSTPSSVRAPPPRSRWSW